MLGRSLYQLLILPVLVAGMVLLDACTNGLITPQDPTAPVTVTTSLGGVVVDQNGAPMAGVTVTAHGATTQTNNYGVYVFKNISVPSERACVVARKGGYFTAARAEWPTKNGTTVVQLTLQKVQVVRTVTATSGGTASIAGATITFPANAFATTSGGTYSGVVNVGLAYLTPDNASNFATFFSGDASAQRADNSSAELTSYGVVRVQLTGASGEQLQLRSGSTATITYPVPTSLASSQPSTIPLWYFDESIGLWKEEGQASLQGGMYVGSVSHFTDWNLDVPNAQRAYIEGTVRCSADRPVGHVYVNIGQVMTYTDENGHYKRRVPANTTFTVEVLGVNNGGMSAAPITVGPIGASATQNVDIMVSPCPTTLDGILVDCSNKPIGGFIQIKSSQGLQMTSTSDGTFRARVPSGEVLTVTAFSIDAQASADMTVAAITSGNAFNMGVVQACGGPQQVYSDIDVGSVRINAMAYTDNGATLAVLDGSTVSFYDVASGSMTRSFKVAGPEPNTYAGNRIMFSTDGSVMLVGGPYSKTQVFQTATGNLLAKFDDPGNAFLTADGKYVIASDSSGKISQFDATTGAKVKTFSVSLSGGFNLLGLQNGGAKFVVSLYNVPNLSIVVWDVATDSKSLDIPFANQRESSGNLSPDGTLVGTLSPSINQKGGAVEFYNLVSGAKVSSISSGTDSTSYAPMPAAISPTNTEYVSMSYGTTNASMPMMRKVSDGSTLKILPVPSVNAYGSAYTFDVPGSNLAVFYTAQSSNIIRIYKL